MSEPVELPFEPSTPSYRFSTTLEDRQFNFDVRWNARAGAWYFDLLDESEVVIRYGIKVVLGVFLGARSASDRSPRGVLIASDTTGQKVEAGFDDLGTRVKVLYYTPEQLQEL